MKLCGNGKLIEACAQIKPSSGEAYVRVITLYRRAIEKVRAAELERLHNRLPSLDEQSKQEIHLFVDRLVANMLDPPLESLRQETHDSSRTALIDALGQLFRLND